MSRSTIMMNSDPEEKRRWKIEAIRHNKSSLTDFLRDAAEYYIKTVPYPTVQGNKLKATLVTSGPLEPKKETNFDVASGPVPEGYTRGGGEDHSLPGSQALSSNGEEENGSDGVDEVEGESDAPGWLDDDE